MQSLPTLGVNLTHARKRQYPNDTQVTFAVRVGVSKATYSRMEKGDLSIGLGKYHAAAKLLDLQDTFEQLLLMPVSLLDD